VLVPPALGPWTPRARLHRWSTVRSLLRVAAGASPEPPAAAPAVRPGG
jgi:hypothetical protein